MTKLWTSYAYPSRMVEDVAGTRLLEKATCPCVCLWCNCWQMPAQVSVTISGLTNGTCAQCTAINTTFILSAVHVAPNRNCEWRYYLNECIAGSYVYCFVEDASSPTLNVVIGQFWGTSRLVGWKKALVSPGDRDCTSWLNESLAYYVTDSSTNCNDAPTSTCLVSAV